jgi:hypothetical protein
MLRGENDYGCKREADVESCNVLVHELGCEHVMIGLNPKLQIRNRSGLPRRAVVVEPQGHRHQIDMYIRVLQTLVCKGHVCLYIRICA